MDKFLDTTEYLLFIDLFQGSNNKVILTVTVT